jgi:hypothetical protein
VSCATVPNGYHFDEHGGAPGLRPVTGFEHERNGACFSMDDYHFEPGARCEPGTRSAAERTGGQGG